MTAKISGCILKQGSKTHSSLRPSNSQLQNDAALLSCRIRAVKHRKCVAGPSGAHPCLQDRILQNRIKIESCKTRSNLAKLHKNGECASSTQENLQFLLCIEVQQTFSFPFSLLRHYQIPECFLC